MTYTIDNIIKSIAAQVSLAFPAYPVYDSPNQQGTDFPCFFIFLTTGEIADQLSGFDKRDLSFDLVFVQERNKPNANAEIYDISDTLDEILDMVTYTAGEESVPLHTHDRSHSIEDQELHYKFRIPARVSKAVEHIPMQILEENDVKVQSERGSGTGLPHRCSAEVQSPFGSSAGLRQGDPDQALLHH